MAHRMVLCAKFGRELPGLDESTPEGERALRMAQLLGGPELRQRVHDHVSAEAWALWTDFMRMVINEYHLDPTSEASNAILREHMEGFLFGAGGELPNYTPPGEHGPLAR
jgi:Fe-S cluster biosynthesis and repair protein YggX